MLFRYRHLEMIPDSASDWEVTVRGADKLAATLVERKEDALLYRTLTTLAIDVPLLETLGDLEWKGIDSEAFAELCEELGFESLSDRVVR